MAPSPKRILLATIGSLGDLHPMLALALALRERGHIISIATTEVYRVKIEALGFEFHSLRPNFSSVDPALMRYIMDMRRGPRFLLCDLILPALKDTYDDLLAAASGVDLFLAGEIVFAAPLVAERLRMPWVSVILSPFSFYSAYEPPVSPLSPALSRIYGFGPPINRVLIKMVRTALSPWWKPVRRLRRELGLSKGRDPLFFDKFSAELTLALFSPEVGPPQPDWPANTVQPGYVYYDREDAQAGLAPELAAYLDAGPPPIVFTLGSSAVHDPRGFFDQSAEAARLLGRRAAFLCGENPPAEPLPQGSIAVPYAPFSEIFPRAAIVVHQGGSGTTAQALRAGRPALIMPCGFDQPDNAARIQKLGVGLTLSRTRYNGKTAAQTLRKLLDTPSYAENAVNIGERLSAEDGVGKACHAIERLLQREA